MRGLLSDTGKGCYCRPDSETMSDSPGRFPFESAARRALRRVVLRRWIGLLRRTAWPVAGAALLAMVWRLSAGSGISSATGWTAAIALAWAVITATWAFLRRPSRYAALALWDEKTGRRDAFANAWFCEQAGELSEAQRIHCEAEEARLATALPSLPKDLPLEGLRQLWPVPAVLLAWLGGAILATDRTTERPLDASAQDRLQQETKRLAERSWDKQKLSGLGEKEKSEIEKLKQNLADTAKALESAGGKSAREVLAAVEKNARAAEKLAEDIAADRDAWASEKLIEALRSHADTADLGDAVAGKSAGEVARSAEALAKTLGNPDQSDGTQQRIGDALEQARQSSEPEDAKRTVGQHVLAAGSDMAAKQPAKAAEELQKLAERMKDLARRDEVRRELEKLAQELREGGGGAGQSGGAMQQVAGAEQQSQGQQGDVPQAPLSAPSQNQPQLTPPGLGQNQPPMMSPPSGAGQQGQQLPMLSQVPPGTRPGKGEGKPLLLAPVPGQPSEKSDKPPEMIVQSDDPPGKPDGMIAIAAPDSGRPGAAKADLKGAPTEKQATAGQSVVNAQSSGEGPSAARAVEGAVHRDHAARGSSELAVEFLQAEEAALDEMALPPARREQVRRYFTELRKRLEKQK